MAVNQKNYRIPVNLCRIKYSDLDSAVAATLHFKSQGTRGIHMAKTNLKAAFRGLPGTLR